MFEIADLALDAIGVATRELFIPADQRLCFALFQVLLLFEFPLRGGRVEGSFFIFWHGFFFPPSFS